MKIIKKYRFLIIVLFANVCALIFYPQTGLSSIQFTYKNFLNFIFILAPVFVLIGLMDVWIDKETMIKITGEDSKLRGILISFALGILTAVPIYALLPIAGMLLKKGSKISNVLIFICASASIRIPLLLFEVSFMGWKFMAVRFGVNLCVVFIIAFLIDGILSEKDKKGVYDGVSNL